MKLSRVLIFAFIATLFFSCGKDEADEINKTDETENNGNGGEQVSEDVSILGDWNICLLEYEGVTSYEYMETENKINYTGIGKNLDCKMTIADSPEKSLSTEGGYDIVLTTTSMGQTSEETISMTGLFGNATWKRNSDILTITDTETKQPQDFTIEKLTKDSLAISFDVDSIEMQNGIEVRIQMEGLYKFAR